MNEQADVTSKYLSKHSSAIGSFLRRCIFRILSFGPMPDHIAFILDGNRRYAQERNLKEGEGYRHGFLSLMSMIKHCYDMGVKYVTIFAFSIDNFNRKPEEVQYVMDLMHEKIQGLLHEQSFVNSYGVKVVFLGNLKLLHEHVRVVAEKAMAATAQNTKVTLLICVAYTSTDEIVHAVQHSIEEKLAKIENLGEERNAKDDGTNENLIPLEDLEKHFYFGEYPDPDILIRTSGGARMSNFILWQSTFCLLENPQALWPEISLRHLVWAILQYQRAHPSLQKNKKKLFGKLV